MIGIKFKNKIMTEEPFSKQQKQLSDAFKELKNSVRSKIDKIDKNDSGSPNDKDLNLKAFRQELDKQVEHLHLMISSYFGDCDRRKQQIEAVISEQVDVSDFRRIGESLLT